MRSVKDKCKLYSYTDREGRMVTVAATRYAGKTVRGTAVCSPDDEFDPDKGAKIAIARCAFKIAKKRLKYVGQKYMKASIAADEAVAEYQKMGQYYRDVDDAFDEAVADLREALSE